MCLTVTKFLETGDVMALGSHAQPLKFADDLVLKT